MPPLKERVSYLPSRKVERLQFGLRYSTNALERYLWLRDNVQEDHPKLLVARLQFPARPSNLRLPAQQIVHTPPANQLPTPQQTLPFQRMRLVPSPYELCRAYF